MARVLLDQNVPHGLRAILDRHEVFTAAAMGWAELANGELLSSAEKAGFEVLVTADKNLRHQQDLGGRHLGVVLLDSNRWLTIKASSASIVAAVDRTRPGSIIRIAFDQRSRR